MGGMFRTTVSGTRVSSTNEIFQVAVQSPYLKYGK